MEEIKPIYLDYNSTTPLDPAVISTICRTLTDSWANPSSNSASGKKAKQEINSARRHIAVMLDAGENDKIIFTSGGTEASNMAIWSAYTEYMNQNQKIPHIITSSVEHDATLKMIEHLASINQIEYSSVRPEDSGQLRADSIINCIKPNTCLITIMMANNETGVLFPIEEVSRELKSINQARKSSGMPKIYFHTDAAQAIGKVPVSVTDLQVDYLTVVGHKFYGPRNGCLYSKSDAPVHPLLFGGGQEYGYRPGTENTPMIAGLGEAAKCVTEGLVKYNKHMNTMRNYFETKLMDTFSEKLVKINFKTCPRLPNTISACFVGVNAQALLKHCSSVVASTSAACHSHLSTSKILQQLLPPEVAVGTVRLSVGRETTTTDINLAVSDIHQAYARLTDELIINHAHGDV